VAKLIYSAITSLDGYVADEDGNFDWAAPDEEVHTFVNDLERPVGTYLYGRRMYEVMVYWETAHTLADQPPFVQDFAEIWQAADKIVYSKRLETVSSARTRIEREFDPEAVRQMKAAAGRDITVGGPTSPPRPSRPGGRRVPPVPRARRRGRRQTVPPRQGQREARTAGRTPFRQRGGLPPLPHRDVKRRGRYPDV
jgi:dihydrofolate reductase